MKFLSLTMLVSFFLTAFSAFQTTDESSGNFSESSVTGMLQHNVYFYLNEDVTTDEREQFEKGLRKLLSIEAIYKFEIGIPGSTTERDVTDHSFGYSIFTWFESMEDYNVYAEHPVHIKFIENYSHLWADVKVYDSEIIQTDN